jgi:predicted dehydrogenase
VTKRIGIIGAGQIFETVHYKNYIKYPEEVEIIAVVDANLDRAKAVAEKYNIPYYFDSSTKMFESVKLDIVSVCVPNKYHYENVILALKNNCHVLCEKPPSINAGEAKEMMDLAKKQKKILAYNFHFRHSKEAKFIKNQVEKETFGEIYYVKVRALRRRGIPGWGNFINKSLQGGGPLIDIGVHMLDLALYLLDYPEVDSVMAASYQKIGNKKKKGLLGEWDPTKFEVEDSAFAFIKFKNGMSLNLETAFALYIKENSLMNVNLYGDKAGASVFPMEIYTDMDEELVDITMPFSSEEDKHSNSIRHFLDACSGKDALISNGEEGYKIQAIIEAIYKSAEIGDVVKL